MPCECARLAGSRQLPDVLAFILLPPIIPPHGAGDRRNGDAFTVPTSVRFDARVSQREGPRLRVWARASQDSRGMLILTRS